MPMSEFAFSAALNISSHHFGNCLHHRKGCNDLTLFRKMSFVIPDIEMRKLVFPDTTSTGKKGTIPKFLRLEPPEPYPCIPKIDKAAAWSLWARCQTCHGNKFLPMMMNGQAHVACYYCVPPHQYAPIGATRVNRSLIGPDLKKYY